MTDSPTSQAMHLAMTELKERAERVAVLEEALRDLVAIIDSAKLSNLCNGVQLGPTVWYVKASDCMDYAHSVLNKETNRA
jgi:hypothetical protein